MLVSCCGVRGIKHLGMCCYRKIISFRMGTGTLHHPVTQYAGVRVVVRVVVRVGVWVGNVTALHTSPLCVCVLLT